jgi:hypothetical protein
MTRTDDQWDRLIAAAPDLLEALKLALPYVEKIAATAPTEYGRMKRRLQAVGDAKTIRAAIAKAGEQP